MGEKIKNKSNFILQMIKSSVIGVVVSILLVLLLAFVLKFIEIPDRVITIIDEVIKIVSIFVAVISLVKKSPYKILFKGFLVGALYSVLTFVVFSALGGSYVVSIATIIDVVLGGVVGAIVAILLNVFSKEKVSV